MGIKFVTRVGIKYCLKLFLFRLRPHTQDKQFYTNVVIFSKWDFLGNTYPPPPKKKKNNTNVVEILTTRPF